jgi:hypothetical protein
VKFDQFNTQGQPQFVWPASFVLARAYLDQLQRENGLSSGSIASARKALDAAEQQSGAARQGALTTLAQQLDQQSSTAKDATKTQKLAGAVRDLAATAS